MLKCKNCENISKSSETGVKKINKMGKIWQLEYSVETMSKNNKLIFSRKTSSVNQNHCSGLSS